MEPDYENYTEDEKDDARAEAAAKGTIRVILVLVFGIVAGAITEQWFNSLIVASLLMLVFTNSLTDRD